MQLDICWLKTYKVGWSMTLKFWQGETLPTPQITCILMRKKNWQTCFFSLRFSYLDHKNLFSWLDLFHKWIPKKSMNYSSFFLTVTKALNFSINVWLINMKRGLYNSLTNELRVYDKFIFVFLDAKSLISFKHRNRFTKY